MLPLTPSPSPNGVRGGDGNRHRSLLYAAKRAHLCHCHGGRFDFRGRPGVAQGWTGIIDLSRYDRRVPVSFSGLPTPNEEIASGMGFSVILNQQILSTAETKGITTNAIAIVLKDFGPSDVTGNIDFGQSTRASR